MNVDRMYSMPEAAAAYAKSARILIGDDPHNLQSHPAMVAVVTANMYQAVEIALKYIALSSAVLSEDEYSGYRGNPLPKELQHNGHDIDKLLLSIGHKVGIDNARPGVTALCMCVEDRLAANVIRAMLINEDMNKTRKAYRTRMLGYVEIGTNDVAVIKGWPFWSNSVLTCVENLEKGVRVLSCVRQASDSQMSEQKWHKEVLQKPEPTLGSDD